MPVINRLMQRLGFVKLSSFGLVLTPDGRVLSMRPAVLDDGLGGRIVGWKDGDLAAAELEKWEPAMAPKAATATRVAPPLPPRPPVPTGQHRVVPTAASASVVVRETSLPATVAQVPTIKPPAPRVTQPPAPVAAANVAPQPAAEEDDWEWTIAVARARAAADEAEAAAAAPPPPAPAPVAKFAPVKTMPIAKVADDHMESWPKTEQFEKDDEEEDDDYTKPDLDIARVVQRSGQQRVVLKATPPKPLPVVVPPQVVAANNQYPRAKSPATVIPVPKLPSVKNPGSVLNLEPVVRAEPPRRIAKGTDPLLPKSTTLKVVPQNNEDTVPHMILPTAAQTVALPSVMKRASRG